MRQVHYARGVSRSYHDEAIKQGKKVAEIAASVSLQHAWLPSARATRLPAALFRRTAPRPGDLVGRHRQKPALRRA